jgi:hypothetical protein
VLEKRKDTMVWGVTALRNCRRYIKGQRCGEFSRPEECGRIFCEPVTEPSLAPQKQEPCILCCCNEILEAGYFFIKKRGLLSSQF